MAVKGLDSNTWVSGPKKEESAVLYSLVEKQLAAVYAALLATEAVPGTAPVTVRTTHAIAGCVRDWMSRPHSGSAQTPLLARWGASLQ